MCGSGSNHTCNTSYIVTLPCSSKRDGLNWKDEINENGELSGVYYEANQSLESGEQVGDLVNCVNIFQTDYIRVVEITDVVICYKCVSGTFVVDMVFLYMLGCLPR